MYNLWWVVIGLIVLLAIEIALNAFLYKKNYLFDEWQAVIFISVYVVLAVSIIVLLTFSIVLPIKANKEYREFEATRQIIELSAENGSGTENIAITRTIIQANVWLAQARADKAVHGNWSMYFGIDLDKVGPITIR